MSLDFSLIVRVDTGGKELERIELFTTNYTHNVTRMWEIADVYKSLYDSDGKKARSIIKSLEFGVSFMEENRKIFELHNPNNGWGDYLGALHFLREVLEACKKHPKSIIEVSK